MEEINSVVTNLSWAHCTLEMKEYAYDQVSVSTVLGSG